MDLVVCAKIVSFSNADWWPARQLVGEMLMLLITLLTAGEQEQACLFECLFAYLFVCPLKYLSNYTSKFYHIFGCGCYFTETPSVARSSFCGVMIRYLLPVF